MDGSSGRASSPPLCQQGCLEILEDLRRGRPEPLRLYGRWDAICRKRIEGIKQHHQSDNCGP